MYEKEKQFVNEFIALCKKYDLGIRSQDDFCDLKIVPFYEVEDCYEDPVYFDMWELESLNDEPNDDELD